jgi:hypothetical protein
MNKGLAKTIQLWFAKHDGDGEFALGTRALPFSVIRPAGAAAPVLYTTKPSIVTPIIDREARPGFGMIGRYGLPGEADLRWIHKVIGRHPLLFLGDMDPVDLMVFAWLRAVLRPRPVTYLGVNDDFLKALELPSTGSSSIPCAPSERASIALLKRVFPDLTEKVGHKCAEMLERGEKVELDVIVSNREEAAMALGSLLSL